MDIIDSIRKQQSSKPFLKQPPAHQPEMLYIGCVDARLDPIEDLGIPKGKALIFRNIAALVSKNASGHKVDEQQALTTGEIPQSASIGAVLEFFLNHLPKKPDQVRHIVISGHTDCGGIKACCAGTVGEHDEHLPRYMDNLKEARAAVLQKAKEHGWDDAQIRTELEKESVRSSIKNLMEYKSVQKAVAEGSVQLHGWVLDTANGRINELNQQTQEFAPMQANSNYVHRAANSAGLRHTP